MSWDAKRALMTITFIIAMFFALLASVMTFGLSPPLALLEVVVTAFLFVIWYRYQAKKSKKKAEELLELLKKDRRLALKHYLEQTEKQEIVRHFFTFWTMVPVAAILVFSTILFFQYFRPLESPIFYQFTMVLPNFITAPFFLFMWMFIWYGSLTLPGYVSARLIKPGDAEYGMPLSDIRAQDHAVEEAKKQMELLYSWSGRKKVFQPGIFHIFKVFLFWWIIIPVLLVRWLYLKHLQKKKTESQKVRQILTKPQHMILHGPPGVGKTMLGKGIATESNLPVLIIPATIMHQPFMGVGVILWNLITNFKIYRMAKKYGGVIVVMDEIDAFAQARSGTVTVTAKSAELSTNCGITVNDPDFNQAFDRRVHSGVFKILDLLFYIPAVGGLWGAGGTEAVLTQFLMMLDGINAPPMVYQFKKGMVNMVIDAFFGWIFLLGLPTKIAIGGQNVYFRLPPGKPEEFNFFVIGLTNRFEVLDAALLRPGRLERHIYMGNPSHEGRKQIADLYFGIHTHDDILDTEEYREKFARLTKGESPVMIKAFIEGAAHLRTDKERAYGKEQPPFDWQDVLEARRTIKYGHALPGRHSQKSEQDTLVHEAGHFLNATEFLSGAEEAIEFSVVTRRDSRGRVDMVPVDELAFETTDRRAYEGKLRVLLGGRILEEIIFNEQRSGARGDLKIATAMAAYMVGELGYTPRDCPESYFEQYKKMGEKLFSLASDSLFGKPAIVEDVLGKEPFRTNAAVFLGQAYVDVDEFFKANKGSILEFIERFKASGKKELSSDELEEMMEGITLIPLGLQVNFPDRQYENPFRGVR